MSSHFSSLPMRRVSRKTGTWRLKGSSVRTAAKGAALGCSRLLLKVMCLGLCSCIFLCFLGAMFFGAMFRLWLKNLITRFFVTVWRRILFWCLFELKSKKTNLAGWLAILNGLLQETQQMGRSWAAMGWNFVYNKWMKTSNHPLDGIGVLGQGTRYPP